MVENRKPNIPPDQERTEMLNNLQRLLDELELMKLILSLPKEEGFCPKVEA